MLTIENIRNPKRQSGFSHVHSGSAGPNGGGKTVLWKARSKGERLGPYRRFAHEAAQDYCNFVNGLPTAKKPKRIVGAAKLPALNLKRANHPQRRRTVTSSTSNRTPTRKRPRRQTTLIGTVYLIGEVGNADVVKIGWSKDSGFARLRELQTGNHRLLCGISERPGTKLDEYNMHLRHEADNVLNEWFEVSPGLLSEFDVSVQAFECAVGAELETV